jgi:ClpP class serine protease
MLKFIEKYLITKKIKKIAISKFDKNTNIVLEKKLQSVKPISTKSLFIELAGHSSKLTQCEDISNQIVNFRKTKKDIPVNILGTDVILGTSLLVLLSGDNAYVDKNSIMGLYDFNIKRTFFHDYLKENNFHIKFNTAGNYKIRLNPFETPKERDSDWAFNYLSKQKELFIEKVFELRSDKLKISKNELENYLNAGILNPHDALKIGLIDGYHSVETLKYEKYKDTPIRNVKGQGAILKSLMSSRNIDLSSLIQQNENLMRISEELDLNESAIIDLSENLLKRELL